MADLFKILLAEKLGHCDSLYESVIGKKLGGYSWLSDYETTPYLYRAMPNMSHYYNREIMEEVVGGSVGWNQLVDENTASVTIQSGHKYYSKIDSTHSVALSNGSAISVTGGSDMLTDLTLALGSTIADYVYSLEQATAGSGVAWLKQHFPRMFGQYNPYDAGSIQSVSGLVSHTTKDANDNVIGTYPLDSTLTLRGIPKLDNGKLYYDGDTYGADGSVSRKYGVVDLGTLNWSYDSDSGFCYASFDLPRAYEGKGYPYVCAHSKFIYSGTDINWNNPTDGLWVCPQAVSSASRIYAHDSTYTSASAFKTAMNGVMLVYELATPTTETAQPFTKTQLCDSGGTEEWTLVGKNLYAPTYETGNALYEFTDTGVRVYNSTAGSYKNASFKLPISKLIGKTLTFSASAIVTSGEARALCTLRNSAGTSKGTMFELTDTSYNRSFTVPSTAEDTDYLRFTFYSTGGASDSGDVTYSNIQLELGSTATPYEPYGFNIVSVGHKSKYAEK